MGKGKDLYTSKQFIEAIKGSGGIISAIAARVGCEWHTAKKYIENYPTIAAAYADECEAINDLAESTLIKSIKAGDTQDAKWWLSRKRKDVFSERQELTGKDGEPMRIRFIDYGISTKDDDTGTD